MYAVNDLLGIMVEADASDLYVTVGAYPMVKISGEVYPIEKEKLDTESLNSLKAEMLSPEQLTQFHDENELDYTLHVPSLGRFRINYFRQRENDSFVVRRIETNILSLDDLGLPVILKDLSLKDRGLILVVGATGSGKSTTLAAMIDYRNTNKSGHILTLEDPIEFVHEHKKSIVNQREVGNDTNSYTRALKSALREAPSVLLIGEIRDQESMQAALSFSETGHLVFTTLHATNAPQTIERVMSFFEQAQHEMIQMQLSQNLLAVVAQRLVPTVDGSRAAALEVMLTTARVRDLIQKGSFELLRSTIEAGISDGMQLFDHSLHTLYSKKRINEEMAYEFADQPTDLKLKIASQEERVAEMDIELLPDEEDSSKHEDDTE